MKEFLAELKEFVIAFALAFLTVYFVCSAIGTMIVAPVMAIQDDDLSFEVAFAMGGFLIIVFVGLAVWTFGVTVRRINNLTGGAIRETIESWMNPTPGGATPKGVFNEIRHGRSAAGTTAGVGAARTQAEPKPPIPPTDTTCRPTSTTQPPKEQQYKPSGAVVDANVTKKIQNAYMQMSRGEYESAVTSAGSALDVALHGRFDPNYGTPGGANKMTMNDLFNAAVDAGVIQPYEKLEVQLWWKMRIDVTHGTRSVSKDDAQVMVDGVANLLKKL